MDEQEMARRRRINKKIITIFGVVLVPLYLIIAIASIMAPEEPGKPPEKVLPASVKPAARSRVKPAPGAELSKESVSAVILYALGETNRKDIARVQLVKLGPFEDATKVTVHIAANDGPNDIAIGIDALDDARKVARDLRDTFPKMGYLEIRMTSNVSHDEKGNEREAPIAMMGFMRDTLDKIDFDKLIYEDLIDAADFGWVTPSRIIE